MHLIMMTSMEILANCYSNGFLRIIIKDKRESVRANTFGGCFNNLSGNFYFSPTVFSFFFLLLELFTNPLFIPSGLTKGYKVTMGHNKEIFQPSANESARKYSDFTIGASKTLVPCGKLENLMYVLWGLLSG